MCRIVGFLDTNTNLSYHLSEIGDRMRDTMIAGGPDSCGNYIDNENGLYLGHRRLSIIELSPLGHQPMEVEDYVISFNGEIYNYKEIQKELKQEGVDFRSNSDTEVILRSFKRWGVKAVDKFRGMFAFAIWHKPSKTLQVFRDRNGVKPLYYSFEEGRLVFASELKAFHKYPYFSKTLDKEAIGQFLQRGYISAPLSIFEQVKKLRPGHFLKFNIESKDLTIHKYWDIADHISKSDHLEKSELEYQNELEEKLEDAFGLRMVADVPVGMFLSGGVDSSIVTAMLQKQSMQKVKTFTIGFDIGKYDESPFAKKVAEHIGTDHHELICNPKDAFNIIPELPEIYDEPFGDSSAIPTTLVSRLAKEHVKVSLSADGGDEQFFGYNRFKMFPALLNGKSKYLKPVIPFANGFIKSFSETSWSENMQTRSLKLQEILQEKGLGKYEAFTMEFNDFQIQKLGLEIPKRVCSWDDCDWSKYSIHNQMMLWDLKHYMVDDILTKVDRATMSVALEGREPFLDHQLMEYTAGLPMPLKFKNDVDKYILRQILYKYVPKSLIERPKMGFGVPLEEWFKEDLSEMYKDYLSEDKVKKAGMFDPRYVGMLKDNFLNGKLQHHRYKLWFLFIFHQWKEYWKID